MTKKRRTRRGACHHDSRKDVSSPYMIHEKGSYYEPFIEMDDNDDASITSLHQSHLLFDSSPTHIKSCILVALFQHSLRVSLHFFALFLLHLHFDSLNHNLMKAAMSKVSNGMYF